MGRQLKTSEAFSKSTHCEPKYSRNVSACSGASSPDPAMTVEEYAAATSSLANSEEGEMTWGQFIAASAPVLKEMEMINPPDEVREYHQAWVAIMQAVIAAGKKQDQKAFMNPYLFLSEGPVLLLGMQLNNLEEEMPDDARQVMIKHDLFVKTPRQPGARWG